MPVLSFSKLIPGGNPTLILHDPDIRLGDLPGLSARLMHPMHLQAEQVGALFYGQAHEWSSDQPDWSLPRLEMMGGEFCVNAARSAAFCLARQGSLAMLAVPDGDSPVWFGALEVSGMTEPVRVLVSSDLKSLERAMDLPEGAILHWNPGKAGSMTQQGPVEVPAELFCAALVSCAQATCRQVQKGVTLVALPGMCHLLVDTDRHPLPDIDGQDWKRESAAWRTLCGLDEHPASGVVWYRNEGDYCRIWPAVTVQATASEHLESACGSASLAMALLRAWPLEEHGAAPVRNNEPLTVIQPSGQSLHVRLKQTSHANPECYDVWVAGRVSLAATGDAFL